MNIAILGSTGSIGTQALHVIRDLQNAEMTAQNAKNDTLCRNLPHHSPFSVRSLTTYQNVALLENQIREFRPPVAAVADPAAAADLKVRVGDLPVKILSGPEGVEEAAACTDADIVLNALVGIAGLKPTLAAIQSRKKIALANKETLVAGGELVMAAASRNGVDILPVDSEHSAIFQCLAGHVRNTETCPLQPSKLILTASGGPFFGKSREQLQNVKAADALQHPTWNMGAKISVDCATMMNKGLEIIEAVYLFGLSEDRIDVVIHRESVIHSMVEYEDGTVIAQMGLPDMRLPIQYALTYPQRVSTNVCKGGSLDIAQYGSLTFFPPDEDTFRCMGLCREAIRRGGLYPAALSGANEAAVALFLEGRIGFFDIERLVSRVLDGPYARTGPYSLEDVLEADRAGRELSRCESSD